MNECFWIVDTEVQVQITCNFRHEYVVNQFVFLRGFLWAFYQKQANRSVYRVFYYCIIFNYFSSSRISSTLSSRIVTMRAAFAALLVSCVIASVSCRGEVKPVGLMCRNSLNCKGLKRAVEGVTDGCNVCDCGPGIDWPFCTRMLCPRPRTDVDRKKCERVRQENEKKLQRARQ